MTSKDDIILTPADINLEYSPLRRKLKVQTRVLGAFNPGLTRLPNGNLLMMVRIAEELKNPVIKGEYQVVRWCKKNGFVIDKIPVDSLEMNDPRKYRIKSYQNKTFCLTSFSWLLPVELSENGDKIEVIHYEKIILPEKEYQEFGIEDARITKIDKVYYMTACAVSSYRHSTILYSSSDGLNYELCGIILDHQNKDMVLFPRKIGNFYYALTRPTGDHYFASDINNLNTPGPAIYLAQSPDLLHWKPVENFFIQAMNGSMISEKVGGGAPPIEIENGWLIMFHGVQMSDNVGSYRTFICILDKEFPYKILYQNYHDPVLECNDKLTESLNLNKYLGDIVFTSGIEEDSNNFIISSGELDLCCRISVIPKIELNKFIRQSERKI